MFKTNKQLLSNEEAVGVDKFLGDKASSGYSDADLEKINALIEALDIREEERLPRWDDGGPDCFRQRQVHDDFQILQTREERWRLAKLEGRLTESLEEEDEIETLPEEPAAEDDISDYDERLENDRPAKRSRLDGGHVSDTDFIQTAEGLVPPQVDNLESTLARDDAQVLNPAVEIHQASNLETGVIPGDNLVNLEPDFAPLADDILCNDFADDFEANKENWPPSTPSLPVAADDVSSDYYTPEHMRQYLAAQYGTEDSLSQCYLDLAQESTAVDEEADIQLLSFNSKRLDYDGQFADERLPKETVDMLYEGEDGRAFVPEANEATQDVCNTETATRQPDENYLGLLLEPSIASRPLESLAFAQLRARKVSSNPEIAAPQIERMPHLEIGPTLPAATRDDVVDQNTLQLPRTINVALSVHRYMASIEFIQKNALLRALSSEECAVELAERPSLVGVDLILDPYSAIIVLSLFTLSARCDSYVERVSQQSWRYSKLLVIFEAYPEQLSKRSSTKYGVSSSGAASELWAYTPPILKAIKKFRRDLNIAEGCGTKDPKSKVTYAFADTVNEAALFIRFFGDQVEAEDETQGALWGDREWLSSESVDVSNI